MLARYAGGRVVPTLALTGRLAERGNRIAQRFGGPSAARCWAASTTQDDFGINAHLHRELL
jgi:hypothetical protein